MKPLLRTFALAAVTALALTLGVRPAGLAAEPAPAAASLDFVPADAFLVVTEHVADLWKHPLGKTLREKLTQDLPDAVKAFRGQLGVGPDEVDRVTVIGLLPRPDGAGGSPEMLVAVTTIQSYDRKPILAAVAPEAREKTVNDRSLYLNPRGQSIAFLNDHTFILGRPDQLEVFLKAPTGKGDGPLAPVLALAGKHCVAGGVDVVGIMRAAPPPENLPPDLKPFKPLFKARLATLTVDLDDKVRAVAQATFPTEADAKEGAAAVDDALDMARGAFVQAMKQLNQIEDAPKMAALLKDVQAALRAAKAEQKGDTVEVQAALAVDPEATTAALAEAVVKVRTAAKRLQLTNDFKQLALATYNYHDAMGRLPPPAITDKNGKPLLSWRVALLPYIEQGSLYNEFHLDEPWDSDHNKKLLEKMPTTFALPDSQAYKDHETHIQAFVGKDTVFDGTKVTLPGIPDGTSNTILFVEAKKAVPWTKPEDAPFDAGKLLPKVGGLTEGGFLAAMCDGSVRMFPLTMKEETLRIWATRNNGQVRPEPEK